MTNIPDATPDPRDVIAANDDSMERVEKVSRWWMDKVAYPLSDPAVQKAKDDIHLLVSLFIATYNRRRNAESETKRLQADLLDARGAAAEAERWALIPLDGMTDNELQDYLYMVCNTLFARLDGKPECLSGSMFVGERMLWSAECGEPVPGMSAATLRGSVTTNPGAAQAGEREA